MKKAVVDPNICIGCGTCVAMAPNTFVMDDKSGKAIVKADSKDTEETIKEAMDSCPVAAITLTD